MVRTKKSRKKANLPGRHWVQKNCHFGFDHSPSKFEKFRIPLIAKGKNKAIIGLTVAQCCSAIVSLGSASDFDQIAANAHEMFLFGSAAQRHSLIDHPSVPAWFLLRFRFL